MKVLPPLDQKLFPDLKKETGIILFLDFDGTLAPIVKRPELARLSQWGRNHLAALSKEKGVRMVIISGRLLANVKKKVGLSAMTYVGNHGLEMRGRGLRFLHPEASQAKIMLKNIARRLTKAFQGFEGIWVEDKIYTLSVHYREAKNTHVIEAKKALLKCLDSELKSGKAVLTEGKKVWEVRPSIAWNKGSAVKWLCRYFYRADNQKSFPVYAGDDVTDESAFRVLKGRGLTLKVTKTPQSESAAAFHVKTPADVHAFLKDLRVFLSRDRGRA